MADTFRNSASDLAVGMSSSHSYDGRQHQVPTQQFHGCFFFIREARLNSWPGLMSYGGADETEAFKRVAAMIDKILKG